MVPRRLHTNLSTGAVVLLAVHTIGPNTPRPTSPPATLRIESLSWNEVWVRVASSPPVPGSGLVLQGESPDSDTSPEPKPQLLIRTPDVVRVVGIVFALDVTVRGAGAVQVYVRQGTSPQERRVAWGRDITLERMDDGHFRSIWKIHSLP